jgi:hypothetical protein
MFCVYSCAERLSSPFNKNSVAPSNAYDGMTVLDGGPTSRITDRSEYFGVTGFFIVVISVLLQGHNWMRR